MDRSSNPPGEAELVQPRLVRQASEWERQLWVLHDPRGGGLERAVLVAFSVALAVLLARLAVLGRISPEHFVVFGLVALVMLGGILASYTGRHVVVKVSRLGLSVDHLEGLLPDEADFDQIWTWPTTSTESVSWRQVHAVVRLPDGRVRLTLGGDRTWIVGTLSPETCRTLLPAIEQGIRMWGAHRQRADRALSDVEALRGRAGP